MKKTTLSDDLRWILVKHWRMKQKGRKTPNEEGFYWVGQDTNQRSYLGVEKLRQKMFKLESYITPIILSQVKTFHLPQSLLSWVYTLYPGKYGTIFKHKNNILKLQNCVSCEVSTFFLQEMLNDQTMTFDVFVARLGQVMSWIWNKTIIIRLSGMWRMSGLRTPRCYDEKMMMLLQWWWQWILMMTIYHRCLFGEEMPSSIT